MLRLCQSNLENQANSFANNSVNICFLQTPCQEEWKGGRAASDALIFVSNAPQISGQLTELKVVVFTLQKHCKESPRLQFQRIDSSRMGIRLVHSTAAVFLRGNQTG